MKVKELKKILEECNDNDEVIMSKDGEGNGFSPLADYSEHIYIPDSTWSGEIAKKELTEEDIAAGYDEEDLYTGDDGQNAIVLWPTN